VNNKRDHCDVFITLVRKRSSVLLGLGLGLGLGLDRVRVRVRVMVRVKVSVRVGGPTGRCQTLIDLPFTDVLNGDVVAEVQLH
jgi:hypothetical protein